MDKQVASELIAEYLALADKYLSDAVRVSDASGVEFSLPWGGEGTSEAGMGATYYPEGHSEIGESVWSETRQGWNPSAHSC